MAVVRLEGTGVLPDAQAVAEPILRDAARPGIQALQIDFDARESERAWYRHLLERLRAGLAAGVPLSITALASWCDGDSWMRDLPVSDGVPMLFRMGAGEPRGIGELPRYIVPIQPGHLDRRMARLRRRPAVVYLCFNPRAWDEEAYRGVLVRARRWQ